MATERNYHFIAGSSNCTAIDKTLELSKHWSVDSKQLSSLLIKILTITKTGLKKYCSIKANHTEVNNMWILKNSTNLLSF